MEIKAKSNHACRLAHLVPQTVIRHKRRHDAVEVPIFLMPEDIAAFNAERGFRVPIESATPH